LEFEDRFGYDELLSILKEAYEQASIGKGRERHAHGGKGFVEQQVLTGQRKYGMGFALGQADKKMEEAFHMENWQSAKRDLLGAIIYVAAAIIYGDEMNKPVDREATVAVDEDDDFFVKPPVEETPQIVVPDEVKE
jgi:hypothetical protein